MSLNLQRYPLTEADDELVDKDHVPRPAARVLLEYLQKLGDEQLQARRAAVDAAIVTMGITFTIYSDGENIDRAWPFDPIPRIMTGTEWRRIWGGPKDGVARAHLLFH